MNFYLLILETEDQVNKMLFIDPMHSFEQVVMNVESTNRWLRLAPFFLNVKVSFYSFFIHLH